MYFAGFGVTGSLLAAVGAAFVVGGGIMAFEQWPKQASASPEGDLAVAASAALPASTREQAKSTPGRNAARARHSAHATRPIASVS